MSGFLQVAAASFAGLFFAAALGKLDSWRAWNELVAAISSRRLVKASMRLGIPAAEAGIAVVLVAAPSVGLGAAAVLLGILAAGVLIVSVRHAGRPCACFGAIMPSEIKRSLAARNGGLAVIAGGAAYYARRTDIPALTLAKSTVVAMVLVVVALSLERRRLNRFARGGLARD